MNPQVLLVGRDEFIGGLFHYAPGQHVTFLAPTGNGKTTLAYELSAQVSSPKLPFISLVTKPYPKDDTVKAYAKKLGHKIVHTWPPTRVPLLQPDPAGWVHWPKTTYDPDRDDALHYAEFRRSILDSYKRGRRILFADETADFTADLGLKREMVTVWRKGRSTKCGLWAASQRPVDIPLHAYSNAQHLFLGRTTEERDLERYRGISGSVDRKLVMRTVLQLEQWQWLYVSTVNGRMCIVDKN